MRLDPPKRPSAELADLLLLASKMAMRASNPILCVALRHLAMSDGTTMCVDVDAKDVPSIPWGFSATYPDPTPTTYSVRISFDRPAEGG